MQTNENYRGALIKKLPENESAEMNGFNLEVISGEFQNRISIEKKITGYEKIFDGLFKPPITITYIVLSGFVIIWGINHFVFKKNSNKEDLPASSIVLNERQISNENQNEISEDSPINTFFSQEESDLENANPFLMEDFDKNEIINYLSEGGLSESTIISEL